MRAALLLLLLAACGASDPLEPEVATDTDTPAFVLDDPVYRFCHVEGADAAEARAFCALLDDLPPERCPGLRATCETGAAEQVLDPSGCLGVRGMPGSTPSSAPERPRAPLTTNGWSCEPPEDWAALARAVLAWGVAIAVGLGVLVLIRVIVHVLGWRRRDPTPDVADAPLAPVIVAEDEVPDVPSADLLGAALGALEGGRHDEAVLLARGAALRRLAEAGRLRLHRARTDREYLRALRRDAAVHVPLGEILRAVEGSRWGGLRPDADVARRVIAAAERVIRGVASVVLLVLLVAAGDAWRYGPEGDAALFEVFAQHGYEVTWRLRGLSTLEDDVDVLVLDLSGITPRADDWEALRAWVARGHVLLVAGEAEVGLPELGTPAALSQGLDARVEPVLEGWLPQPRWPDGPTSAWVAGALIPWAVVGETSSERNARLLGGDDSAVEGPVVVVGALPLGDGGVIAVADARLLWNGALVHPANTTFLQGILDVGALTGAWSLDLPEHVQLATTAAAGSSSPVGSLANARLLPFVLQLFALVALAALWRGWPFAPLRDPPAEGRLHFADHVRALGSRYARLGASRRSVSAFAGLWLARIGAGGLEDAARRAGRSSDEARALVAEAQEVAADPDGASSPRDFTLMEALWRITRRR